MLPTDSSRSPQCEDELKTDVKLLLECLKYHEKNPDVQKDGLLTVASICLQNAKAQECFLESGGLNYVLTLLTTTKHESIMESAMYTLGCATERNVYSQKRLSTRAVFRFLECNLLNKKSTVKLKRTVAYLMLCLVTNNSTAQALINTSHCLDALLDIFRSQFPDYNYKASPESPGQYWVDTHTAGSSLELWIAVTSTLIGCVNNPQNETNQLHCASVFNVALDILKDTHNLQVIRLLASFLSLTAANNGRNQDRLGMLGGMDIIVNALQTVVESLLQEPSPDATDAATQLSSLLVSCVTDNAWNKESLGDLRAVPLLVQVLALDVIDIEVKLKVILTLGHLTEGCLVSQRQLVESDGLGLIVHTMTGQHDEEFTKAATYLLHTCVKCVNSSSEMNMKLPVSATDLEMGYHQSSVAPRRRNLHAKQHLPIPIVNPLPVTSSMLSSHHAFKTSTDAVTALLRQASSRSSVGVSKQTEERPTNEKETDDESRTEQMNANGSTIEALYVEMSARKDLQLKLQEEIKARETLEAEKLTLERREEERASAEKFVERKAHAITQELERQSLIAQQGPDLVCDTSDSKDAAHDDDLNVQDSAMKYSSTTDNSKQHMSSRKEVELLAKKVEELEKQIQHTTECQQSVHNLSTTLCASCESGSPQPAKSVGSGSAQRQKMEKGRGGHREETNNRDRRSRSSRTDKSVASSSSSVISTSTSALRRKLDRTASKSTPSLHREISRKVRSSGSSKMTPNIRRVTKPQSQEAIFRLPVSAITKKRKASSSKQDEIRGTQQSSTPIPSYAESVLPYKQQKYASPMVLPRYSLSSMHSADGEDDDDDLDSILSDVTHCYSAADTDVSWSDIKLNLPVRPRDSRRSQQPRRESSRHCQQRSVRQSEDDNKAYSVKSSGSRRSSRSYVVKYTKSQTHQGRQQNINQLTSPISSTQSISHCPGCEPPIHRPLLTSRNFMYTLEKSRHTCPEHRELHKAIREDINDRKRHIEQRSSESTTTIQRGDNTPGKMMLQLTPMRGKQRQHRKRPTEYEESMPGSVSSKHESPQCNSRPSRRKRQEFSQEEIHNLVDGAQKSGKHWNFILWSHKFKPGRTAVDLKDKYRRLQAQGYPGIPTRSQPHKPVKKCLLWN